MKALKLRYETLSKPSRILIGQSSDTSWISEMLLVEENSRVRYENGKEIIYWKMSTSLLILDVFVGRYNNRKVALKVLKQSNNTLVDSLMVEASLMA